jgi:tetratricopeptide (TPR) repeat protein
MASHSISDEIERTWSIFNEGRVEEALQLILNLKKQEDLSQEDHLKCAIAEGWYYIWLGNFEEALQIANTAYQESLKQDNPLLSIDAIFVQWAAHYWLPQYPKDLWALTLDCERLLESATKEPISEVEQREARIYLGKGTLYQYWFFDFELAISNYHKCVEIFEKYPKHLHNLTITLRALGECYTFVGELEKGLKYQKKSVELSRGSSFYGKLMKGVSLYDIGNIYYELGDLEKGIKYLEEALSNLKNLQGVMYVGLTYEKLIKLHLDKGSIEQANKCIHDLQEYIKTQENLAGEQANKAFLQLSKARILRVSTRTRDWTEAERILKKIVENRGITKDSQGQRTEYPDFIIELCDFYLQELQLTNDLTIINDIQPYLDRLIKESERSKSYSLQAMTYLMQGKLALLQTNMGDARRNLAKAQNIAEEHGLQRLAQSISKEHDKFLEQYEEWENLKKRKTPVSEWMKRIGLDETMERMQGKRALQEKELVNEEPLLLLIMIEGGILVFSYPFNDNWDRDNDLFGSFMSAFTSFSDEFFSEGLDRVKFGQYTIILEILDVFSICYVFKGQSYLAKRKLKKFTEQIKSHKPIMETLENFSRTSQVIETKNFPFLEAFITGIFTPTL